MSVDGYLDKIFDAVCPLLLKEIPENEQTVVLVAYRKYLIDTYAEFLEEVSKESEKAGAAVHLLEKKETDKWESLTADQIRARLLPDRQLEKLQYLSEIAFQDAYSCVLSGNCKKSEQEYERELYQISECLDGIKSYHLDYAKELLSETLLDVNYTYGKSQYKSFRLARRCGKIPENVICPDCQAVNQPGARFCKNCGRALEM